MIFFLKICFVGRLLCSALLAKKRFLLVGFLFFPGDDDGLCWRRSTPAGHGYPDRSCATLRLEKLSFPSPAAIKGAHVAS
jgi:hypothetical protein